MHARVCVCIYKQYCRGVKLNFLNKLPCKKKQKHAKCCLSLDGFLTESFPDGWVMQIIYNIDDGEDQKKLTTKTGHYQKLRRYGAFLLPNTKFEIVIKESSNK